MFYMFRVLINVFELLFEHMDTERTYSIWRGRIAGDREDTFEWVYYIDYSKTTFYTWRAATPIRMCSLINVFSYILERTSRTAVGE